MSSKVDGKSKQRDYRKKEVVIPRKRKGDKKMRRFFLVVFFLVMFSATAQAQDLDGDGIVTETCVPVDNCPDVYNPSQSDCDSDGIGDECDETSGCPDTDTGTEPDTDIDTDTEIDTDTDVLGSVAPGCPVRSSYYNYLSDIDADHISDVIDDGWQQNENAFIVVGDSISYSGSANAYYLGNFTYDYGDVSEARSWIGIKDLTCFPELVGPLDFFLSGTTFDRNSIAQRGGSTASSVLEGSPSRLQQEIDAIDPQYAVVMFGSNDIYGIDAATEDHLIHGVVDDILAVVTELELQGIVPIVLSSPTRVGYETEMALLSEYLRAACLSALVPFVDFHGATWPLPSHGLRDSQHPSIYSYNRTAVFYEEHLEKGANVQNLLTLQALASLYNISQ